MLKFYIWICTLNTLSVTTDIHLLALTFNEKAHPSSHNLEINLSISHDLEKWSSELWRYTMQSSHRYLWRWLVVFSVASDAILAAAQNRKQRHKSVVGHLSDVTSGAAGRGRFPLETFEQVGRRHTERMRSAAQHRQCARVDGGRRSAVAACQREHPGQERRRRPPKPDRQRPAEVEGQQGRRWREPEGTGWCDR